jgi:hypothetical protein
VIGPSHKLSLKRTAQNKKIANEYPLQVRSVKSTSLFEQSKTYRFQRRRAESRAVGKVADKSLARPGRKQATATEDFEFHISYL